MIIRTAEERDVQRIGQMLIQICNVHHDGRPDLFRADQRKYNDEELRAMLGDPENPIFVALDEDGWVCGYCFCQLHVSDGKGALAALKTMYIDDLCVDERCRGKQIGMRLFEHAKAYAKSLGCYHLTLNVWAKNESAIRFYEKCGMQVQKIGMETLL